MGPTDNGALRPLAAPCPNTNPPDPGAQVPQWSPGPPGPRSPRVPVAPGPNGAQGPNLGQGPYITPDQQPYWAAVTGIKSLSWPAGAYGFLSLLATAIAIAIRATRHQPGALPWPGPGPWPWSRRSPMVPALAGPKVLARPRPKVLARPGPKVLGPALGPYAGRHSTRDY